MNALKYLQAGKSILFLWLLIGITAINAQSPDRINYQAVARSASGQALVNQPISVRLSITTPGMGTPVVLYQETHDISTNSLGLFSVQIGGGIPVIGTFSNVSWSDGEVKSLKIELDPDGLAGIQPYTDMGSQQLASVPYAKYGEETRWIRVNAGNIGVGNTSYELSGDSNTAVGNNTLASNNTGSFNSAVGHGALYANNLGFFNTAIGSESLHSNTSGYYNTSGGHRSLYANISGSYNTGSGYQTLYNNTSGSFNTALGAFAGVSASNLTNATALGARAYVSASNSLVLGSINGVNGAGADSKVGIGTTTPTAKLEVANGDAKIYGLTVGRGGGSEISSTAFGIGALAANTSAGIWNTAIGSGTLLLNTTGDYNVALGTNALNNNTLGSRNTALGVAALVANTSGINNTSVGTDALDLNTSGSFNTALGYNTGTNAAGYDNTTCIGVDATATGDNMVRIGNTFVGSIGGQVAWSTLSDARFKVNVQENVPGLAFITKLRPVTYQVNRTEVNNFTGVYNRTEKSNNKTQQTLSGNPISEITTGFIAQEVEQAAKDTGFNFSGIDKPKNNSDYYSLRYAEFVVPIVKAIQEQETLIEQQNKTIIQLQAELQQVKSLLLQQQK